MSEIYTYRDAAVGISVRIRDINLAHEQRASIAFTTDKGERIGAHLPPAERQVAAQALAGDEWVITSAKQPGPPDPIDPADVTVGDVVEVEADDGSWLVRGEVAAVNRDYTPPGLLIHAATEDPCLVHTSRATVRLVRRAEPEPDPAQAAAIREQVAAEIAQAIEEARGMTHNNVGWEAMTRAARIAREHAQGGTP